MKTVIVICDNYKQYRDYVLYLIKETPSWKNIEDSVGIITIDNTRYIPLCHKEDTRKIAGLERKNVEIRIIGNKAVEAFTILRINTALFGGVF